MSKDFRETLYTVDKRGRRSWVYPSIVSGYFYRRRAAVMIMLLLFYVAMPWLVIDGKQAILLDLANRNFVFFGNTFWATDGRFLMLVLGGLAMTLFFVTAFVGRVWCGWACPETVFLEFLFRPLETLIEGSPVRRRRLDEGPWSWEKIARKTIKYLVFTAVSWFLASTFLAYFVGSAALLRMMSGSPLNNLSTFLTTLSLMALLLFQFGWFREQFCTLLCPYARFQSVLMDGNTILVGYDPRRGEPRAKLKAKSKGTGDSGDCVDCGLCVRVCPTGIDIRNGTQMECIHCAACIDACDSIMTNVGRPLGLIRYDTENRFRGEASPRFGSRVILYGLCLLAYTGAFVYLLFARELSEFQLLRGSGDAPFSVLADGRVSNHFQLHLSNKADKDERYSLSIPEEHDIQVIMPIEPFPVKGGEKGAVPVFFNFSAKRLRDGKLETTVMVKSDSGFHATQNVTLFGPDEPLETGGK